MITLNAHALNRIVRCNGSFHMQPPEYSDDETEVSDDRKAGVAAHHVGLEVLAGRNTSVGEFIDHKAPNGVYVTAEMADFAEPFVKDVQSRVGQVDRHIEETVNFQLNPNVFINCRLDLATFDHDTLTLTIDEFKYGWRIVEPVENWQLVAEAIGWVTRYQIAPARIVLNIHQPRPFHDDGPKRSWVFDGGWNEFFGTAYTELLGALATVGTDLAAGEHCYKCPNLSDCPAARKSGYNTIDATGITFNSRLNNDELSAIILTLRHAIKQGQGLLDAYEDLLTNRLKSGQVVSDWFLMPSLANTRFKAGVTPEMLKAISHKDVAVQKLPTPKQAERAGISPLILAAFTERPVTGIKLVHKSADKVASGMFPKPTEKE